MAFIPNPTPDLFTVDHIDRNRANNDLSNLRWATRQTQGLNQSNSERKGSRRSVYQYDIQGNFIAKWDNSEDIEKARICTISQLFKACKEEGKLAGGFTWEYADMEDLEGEEWRPIPYEEFAPLFASNKGRIKRANGKITDGTIHNGYRTVSSKVLATGKQKSIRVHRLVIGAFQGRKDDLQVNHKDGNPDNNCIENLEYVTQQQNVMHAIETGLKPLDKVKTRAVIAINADGSETRYESMKRAAIETGVDSSEISRVCSGVRNTAKGLKWRYAIDISEHLL
jgi:hypothetical protein